MQNFERINEWIEKNKMKKEEQWELNEKHNFLK